MIRRDPPWVPEPGQLALLRACLAPDDLLERRLHEWESTVLLDDVDAGSYRLLPFLYRRVSRLGLAARDHGRLKGVYARHWYLYHRDIAGSLRILADLQDQGLSFLLLKGVALQALVYGGDPPTRPGDDVDILVAAHDATAVADGLVSAGLRPAPGAPFPYVLATYRSFGFSGPAGTIDLNWRLHDYCADPLLEARLSATSTDVDIRGLPFRTARPVYHLLHALVHGSGWNEVPGIRWVLDAGLLARGLDEAEWSLFCSEVAACGWRRPILAQLTFLRDEAGAEVPDRVLETLAEIPPSAAGTLMDFSLTRRSWPAKRATRLAYATYLGLPDGRSGARLLLGYPVGNAKVLMGMARARRAGPVGRS